MYQLRRYEWLQIRLRLRTFRNELRLFRLVTKLRFLKKSFTSVSVFSCEIGCMLLEARYVTHRIFAMTLIEAKHVLPSEID